METPWGAYQLDTACLLSGREAEKAISEGKTPFVAAPGKSTQQFRDPRRLKRAKTVKVKSDGTW